MLHPDSPKSKLIDYLITHKKITRRQIKEFARKWRVEPDTLTRRMRELCNDYKIVRYDDNDTPVSQSRHIAYWVLVKAPKRSEVWEV